METFKNWLEAFAQIPDDAPYVVIDRHTGQVVYRTTYKNRTRARNFADRKDIEYGAIRYIVKLEPKNESYNGLVDLSGVKDKDKLSDIAIKHGKFHHKYKNGELCDGEKITSNKNISKTLQKITKNGYFSLLYNQTTVFVVFSDKTFSIPRKNMKQNKEFKDMIAYAITQDIPKFYLDEIEDTLWESRVNTLGKDIAISCNLVKKNAYNQTEDNCVDIVEKLATKFGYRPLDYAEITERIMDYKGWTLYGGSKPAWLNLRSMANIIIRESNYALTYHVSFEFRNKEYNYGDIDSPILFRIPLAR